jgi:Asp-tRNA(Asn)/Glu-tRNA(Gln) amidotransferase A subunit family amidase
MSDNFTPYEASISEIHEAMQQGDVTSAELVNKYLERIDKYDNSGPELTSIITINQNAEERAAELDVELSENGLTGPLHGIPVLVKDQAETKDITTTFGSKAFTDYIPSDDAEIIKNIKNAGGIVLAKTNLPDWAASWFTYSSALGETKNPYALDRDPGGSSGGTCAGVTANLGTVGIGEDTGGSVRVPASCCNLFGIRVTTGLVSRTGLSPLLELQDTAGPIARTVEDLARLLEVMVGFDSEDRRTGAVSKKNTESYLNHLNPDALDGARLGVLRDAFGDDNDPRSAPVNNVVEDALAMMENVGATLVDPVSIPDLEKRVQETSLYITQSKSDLNSFFENRENAPVDSLQDLFDARDYHDKLDLLVDIVDGPDDPTEDSTYWENVSAQQEFQREILYTHAEHDLDAMIFPDVQVIPPTREELQSGINTAAYPTNTVIGSQSSCPAISIPAGFTDDGLPIGVELLTTPFEEPKLIELAYAYEQAVDPREPPELTPELTE